MMSKEARKREEAYYAGTLKDDYISRKAVLDKLNEECGSCADIGYIFSLPGIAKRKGKWETEIRSNRDGTRSAYYACSVCGVYALDEYKFCPNCGARMEKDDET